MAWIKLQIHPEHHKVLVLSDLTGERPETVFASAVRWFFFLDEHYSGGPLAVTEGSLHRITHWNGRKSLAAAMAHQEIGWLESTSDDRLRPTDPEAHFSQSAKKRALTAERAAKSRKRNAEVTPTALRERDLEKEKEKEEEIEKTERQVAPTRRKAAVAADPDWWGKSGDGRIQFKPTAREWRGITPQDYEHWAQAYPAVDVPLELRRMAEWIIANPQKGRKSEYRAFITRWLCGTQDKGGNRPGSGGGRLFPSGGTGHFAAEARRDAKAASEFTGQVAPRVI